MSTQASAQRMLSAVTGVAIADKGGLSYTTCFSLRCESDLKHTRNGTRLRNFTQSTVARRADAPPDKKILTMIQWATVPPTCPCRRRCQFIGRSRTEEDRRRFIQGVQLEKQGREYGNILRLAKETVFTRNVCFVANCGG